MRSNDINREDYRIFTLFALFWVILGWLGFGLALFGYFHTWIIIIYLIVASALLIRRFIYKKILSQASFELSSVAISIAIIIIILSFFTTPTIFSGRDQGSLSEAAIRLAQNHKLEFSTPSSQEFFKIYGKGKALNFPGFYYTKTGSLITQFPLPYISWLAIFYSLFGLSGLIVANAILLFIFAVSFYLLGRLFMNIIPSAGLAILAITSFPIFWFFKFTLSENIALALLWFGILQLLLFLKEKNNLYFFSMLVCLGLLAFSRIEGLLIITALLLILLLKKDTRDYILANKLKRAYLPLAIFSVIFIFDFLVNFNYFREIGKGLLDISPVVKNNFKNIFLYPGVRMADIFIIYGMMQFLILGAAGIIYFFKNKKFLELVPFFLASPVFIYLIDSHISSDHPWLLRRYAFAIFPAILFYSVLFLYFWLTKAKKGVFTATLLTLIMLNIPLFYRYAFFSENRNLLAQTAEISKNFSGKDLVLVDRLASSDGWGMLTGPMSFLYGKQAVYFFNPNDLDKINARRFDKIYLITPDENISFYENSILGNRMKFYKDYSIETTRLDIAGENAERDINLPDKKTIEVIGKIFEIN
jgi:hypothetical protein